MSKGRFIVDGIEKDVQIMFTKVLLATKNKLCVCTHSWEPPPARPVYAPKVLDLQRQAAGPGDPHKEGPYEASVQAKQKEGLGVRVEAAGVLGAPPGGR